MIFLHHVDARSSLMLLFLNRLAWKKHPIFYSQHTIALKYNSYINFIVVTLIIPYSAAQKNLFKATREQNILFFRN